ncbi:MAG: aromatic amino acid transport family protein [Eubacteriales bacterium]
MKTKRLTFTESLMLVAGAGIGTGILTIPYAINKIGVFGTVTALVFAYAVSAFMYLIIADLTRSSEKPDDLIAILDEHLFSGKGKKALNIAFLVLLVLLLLENLVVYILCAGNVLTDLIGVNGTMTKILFYILASVVVLFGIKGMGVGEKLSMILIGCAILMLMILSCLDVKGSLNFSFGAPGTVFAVYGLFMFAFSAIFSIIQVCNYIEKKEQTGKAVIGGLTLNALITITFTVAVILGSDTVTEIATIGLSKGIGIPFVRILCAVLVLFAMFTSFWSSGFAFADVVSGQFGLSAKLSWLIATVPALLIAVFLPLGVIDYVQIGAGALSVILVMVVLPAYSNAVKNAKQPLLLGKLSGSKALIVAVSVAIILMAISSFIPIK